MSHDHDKSSKDTAADAWLELHLAEELGEVRAPDLRHRILACDSERQAHAAQPTAPTSNSSRWLAAAVLLLGIATVFAVLQLRDDRATKVELDAQDPAPAQEQLLTKSLKEFQKHAATATRISMTADLLGVPNSMRQLVEANRMVLPAAMMRKVVQELQTLKPLQPAGWKWSNSIRIDLPDGRHLTWAVYQTTKRRIGIRGLGDFEMTEPLRALLAPLLEAVALKTRLAGGNVTARDDLLRDGEVSIPKDIERLTCRGLTDNDLALLKRFKKLKTLDLSGCAKTIEGTGLQHLQLLPGIETLKLRYTNVDDDALRKLGGHPALRELDVSNHRRLTGGFLIMFTKSKLQSLKIGWGKTLTDAGMLAMSMVPTITHIDLSGRSMGKLTDAGLIHLGKMNALQHLNVNDMPMPMDTVMGYLGGLPDLRELHATFTNVSSTGLMMLRASHANRTRGTSIPLRSLDLTGCKELQTGTLKQLGNFVNLEQLKLSRTSLRNATGAFQDLQSLNKLTKLELNGLRLDANDCKYLARLPVLTHLNLSFNGDGINDEALQQLATATVLTHLELTGCDNFTDAGLTTLGQLASLKHLDLNTCDGFTIDGLESFRALRPDCELRLPDRFR